MAGEKNGDANVGAGSRAPIGLLGAILLVCLGGVIGGMDRLKNLDDSNKERTTSLKEQIVELKGSVTLLQANIELQRIAAQSNISEERFEIYMLKLQKLNPSLQLP